MALVVCIDCAWGLHRVDLGFTSFLLGGDISFGLEKKKKLSEYWVFSYVYTPA